MRAGLSAALEARLRRVDPTAYVHVDAVVPTAESSKRTKTDWDGATGAGFTTLETGGARLTGSVAALVEHGVSTGYLTDLSDDGTQFAVAVISWGGTESDQLAIHRLRLYLHPRQDGGQPRDVTRWRVRMFSVRSIEKPFGYAAGWVIVPLSDYVDVAVSSDAAGLVTFDFNTTGQPPRPKQTIVRDNTVTPGTTAPPITLVFVYALDADGQPAANVGLAYDSGTATAGSGNTITTRYFTRIIEGYYGPGTSPGAPRMAVDTDSFTAATATFEGAGNRLDLGAVPTGTVEFIARGEVSPGTSLTFEVRNDADSAWVAFQDGDTTDDLAGVGKNQTYKVRVTLTPDAGGDVTPTVRVIGVREYARTPLPNLTRIEGPRWAVDPRTLKGEIGEARLTVLRDGEQDFKDAITGLLANNNPGALEFEVFIGDPNLDRADWLHVETFKLEEPEMTSAAIALTLVTQLARLRQALPRPQLLSTSGVSLTFTARSGSTAAKITRATGSWLTDGYQAGDIPTVTGSASNNGNYVVGAVSAPDLTLALDEDLVAEGPTSAPTVTVWVRRAYTPPASPTLKSVWDDLVDSALAVPGRMRGPGVEDGTTTGLANKAIADGDAKEELDAIAAIAGGGNITSQGQVKFASLFAQQGIAASFPKEEITVLEMTPGLRRRVPESFVAYDWEESEERFRAEVRGVNAPALTAMGEAYIEPYRTDEAIGKWIASDALAQTVADRDVRFRGAGIPTWRFRSTYCYPELEPGDLVAVEAEPFVLRDPFTAASIRGRMWALGMIVASEGCEGRDFTIWIRQFQDFLPTFTTYDRLPTVPPTVEVYLTPIAGSAGQISVRFGVTIGATVYYQVTEWGSAVPDYGDAAYAAYTAPFQITQLDSIDRQLIFYAERNGLRSAIRILRVDQDTEPEATLMITQHDATTVQVQWSVDDDVVFVRLYRKKNGTGNGWPTLDNNVDGQLDQAQYIGTIYVREDGGSFDATGAPLANVVDAGGTARTGIGGTRWREGGYTTSDVVKAIAVPFDRKGEPGTRATADLTVGGAAGPALLTFSATITAVGTACGSPAQAGVQWTVNAAVADVTHDLYVYRQRNGTGWVLVKTEASPVSNLSFTDDLDDFQDTDTSLFYLYHYRYELKAGGTIVDARQWAGYLKLEVSGTCPL